MSPESRAKLMQQWHAKISRRTWRRRLTRFGFIVVNVCLLIVVAVFVLGSRSSGNAANSGVLSAKSADQTTSNPLDQLSSADIAVTVARLGNLEEIGGVTSQATSSHAELASAAVSVNNIADKPQIAASAFKSNRDIHTYVVQPGDTIASIAAKFNVTSDSIKWSNSLGSTVQAGVKLVIPPTGVSGIVYKVKSGDTAASLASKYKADESQIVAYNDAELTGLQIGELIIIPNGTQPAPAYSASYGYYGISFASYAGNDYDFGWCTWYVYNRRAQIGRPVPSNLGNANTWYTIARGIGLPTGTAPQVGAVMVNQPGDHVAVVESVNADGSYVVSEMNSFGWDSPQNIGVAGHQTGGWGRVDYKTEPAGSGFRFIY